MAGQARTAANPQHWDALKDELRGILIHQARQCMTISYSELARLLQTVHMHHRAPHFQRLIREVNGDELAAGRPSLAALIVRKDSGIPGGGFFTHLPPHLPEYSEGALAPDLLTYWQAELQAVCDYWGE